MTRRTFLKVLPCLVVNAALAGDMSNFGLQNQLANESESTLSPEEHNGRPVVKVIGIGVATEEIICNLASSNEDSITSTLLLTNDRLLDANDKIISGFLARTNLVFLVAPVVEFQYNPIVTRLTEIAKAMGVFVIGAVVFPEQERDFLPIFTDIHPYNHPLLTAIHGGWNKGSAQDDVCTSISVLSQCITIDQPGSIDLEDIREILGNSRLVASHGSGCGVDRVKMAATEAISGLAFQGANLEFVDRGLIVVSAKREFLKQSEVRLAISLVSEVVSTGTYLMLGTIYDQQAGDTLRISIFASG